MLPCQNRVRSRAATVTIDAGAWRPDGTVRAILLVSHGACEHGGRYAALADPLAAAGIATYAVDHRGHGCSSGRRGDLGALTDASAAVAALAPSAQGECPGVPWFLLGYSMGAVIALQCALDRVVPAARGLILVAAALDPKAVGPLQALTARAFAAIAPAVGAIAINANDLTSDPDAIRAYRSDPLVHHGRMSLRSVAETIAATARISPRLGEIDAALLTMHGGHDVLAAPHGSAVLHASVAGEDRTQRIYPDAQHDLLHDRSAERVRADIVEWIAERIAQ
jgi:alpha-beta hydrolase superfamily lysophospholipase